MNFLGRGPFPLSFGLRFLVASWNFGLEGSGSLDVKLVLVPLGTFISVSILIIVPLKTDH